MNTLPTASIATGLSNYNGQPGKDVESTSDKKELLKTFRWHSYPKTVRVAAFNPCTALP